MVLESITSSHKHLAGAFFCKIRPSSERLNFKRTFVILLTESIFHLNTLSVPLLQKICSGEWVYLPLMCAESVKIFQVTN